MKTLASKLAVALRKELGREIDVLDQPFTPLPLGGLRPTDFVAVFSFTDHAEIASDGVHVNRKPLNDRTASGYVEERAGHVAVRIDCVALSHSAVQDLCIAVAPIALSGLSSEVSISFGETSDEFCSLVFRDFAASYHSLIFSIEPDKDRPYSRGTLEFRLNGFLSVLLRRKKVMRPAKRKNR